jgi:predicted alpha/beta superfamily hydrolase
VNDFAPIIETIEEAYEIPHLNATRKISALLPYDYYESERKYPVLYLQDGQNLFNPNAPFGDWAIDQSMEMLATHGLKDLIIIAIDHGERERIIEYLPYFNHRFGQGKGRHYIDFMKEKLIPYVNKKYRTLTHYSQTGIGGSSMGGLISLYAGLSEPDIFGKMMIFSPSLWISKIIYYQAKAFKPLADTMIYLYAGAKESNSHVPNVERLEKILIKKTNDFPALTMKVVINDEGEHREIYWKHEFPKALKWLYFNSDEDEF